MLTFISVNGSSGIMISVDGFLFWEGRWREVPAVFCFPNSGLLEAAIISAVSFGVVYYVCRGTIPLVEHFPYHLKIHF